MVFSGLNREKFACKGQRRWETHLIAKTLRGNDGDFIANALVGFEVEGEFGVVSLDNDLGRFLDCFRPDATHCGGSERCAALRNTIIVKAY